MKLSTRTIAMIISVPLALGSASALAFGGGHGGSHGNMGGGMGGKHMLRGLDLTDAQMEELKVMREQHRDTARTSMQEHRDGRLADQKQMQSLLLADNFDEAAVRALAQEMADSQLERRVARARNQHQMLSILTPEQKEQYIAKAEKIAERRAEKMAKHQRWQDNN